MSFWQAAALIFAASSVSMTAFIAFLGYRYDQMKREAKERQHGHRRI